MAVMLCILQACGQIAPYDAGNRVTAVYQPSVQVNGSWARPMTQSTYDLDGNVLTVRDANGHTTRNSYDLLNRLTQTEDAAGDTVSNGYDPVGNKTSVEDADGITHVTTFAYDGLNRLLSTTDAAGRSTVFTYDALNKTQRTDAIGNVTSYTYDTRNRLTGVSYAGRSADNRVYAYDPVGNLTSVTETGNTAANVGYSYDAQNRLGTMTESGRVTSYAYDLNGNIVRKTAPNGDTEADVFDALNRATSETAQTGGSVSLFTYTYGYDLVGNVLTVAESYPSGLNDRLVTNTYDAINRLDVEAVTGSAPNAMTTYVYDPANNRMSKTITGTGATTVNYSYNNLNQLTGYTDNTGRSVALVYDYDGNRTTRTVSGGSDNGTDNYSYDYENRLIGLVKGTGGGGAGTYAYTYDYRTRRVTRDESSAGGVVTSLVFSGGTSVQEYDNGATTPTVEYIRGSDYGGGVGGILYTLRGGTPSYTHENKRGDVVAKTDGSGALTYQAQYEGFGKQVATSGSTLDRQKSNSKDTDPTGLVDEGFRYRDLETGMFISRDPAGFIDGPNLYTYVVQNPWTSFDPEGLGAYPANMKNADPAQKAEAGKILGNILEVEVSALPVVQEIQSVQTLNDPNASKLDKTLAAGALIPIPELGALKTLVKDAKSLEKDAKTVTKETGNVANSGVQVTKTGAMSDEDIQAAADLLNETVGNDKAQKLTTITVTQGVNEDGSVIQTVTSSNGRIPKKTQQAANDLLDNPNVVSEEKGTTEGNAHHSEQRGGRATEGQTDRTQASSSGASHGGAACPECAEYQQANNIQNVTGTQQ